MNRDENRQVGGDAVADANQESPTGNPHPRHFPIVGIGASAGGLDALRVLFEAMPADTGMGFVVVQHLDATHHSLLAELLSKFTTLRVTQVENGMSVEPNRIYVIPPNSDMTISHGILLLKPHSDARGMRMPIDRFLLSLAGDRQEQAIGIILSGTGTDGTLGIRELKANGGLVLVQDPETAQYDGMPRSAIATGHADAVLPLERMPEVLLSYLRHADNDHDAKASIGLEAGFDPLTAILSLLLAKTGHDFRSYKKGTLVRRIDRRVGITGTERFERYLGLLRENDEEVRTLSKDLFIGVTSFFRETEAWTTIAEHVVTPIVTRFTDDAPVRIWVPGCATGEEAYTLAILFAEAFERAKKSLKMLVFATDVDTDALQTGRAGLYPQNIAESLSPERLSRFFVKEGDSYRIDKSLRDLVLFTPHNLTADPPFSKLDLVSCRNLLIYLESHLQEKILRLFHFSLKPDGFLLLGSSEGLGSQQQVFRTISKNWRVFQPEGPSRLGMMEMPMSRDAERAIPHFLARGLGRREPSLADMAQQALVETFAPASVLVTRRYKVLYVYGDTSDYLSHPPGELTDDLLAITRSELRLKTRAALHLAVGENRQAIIHGAKVKRGKTVLAVAITVTPLQQPALVAGLLLVSFHPEPEPARLARESDLVQGHEAEVVGQLEDELKTTREELQSTIEELETSNEELKASNEEVMSMNEELQSSNEELETSREELQSLNEELTTVNTQLQNKVVEVEGANNDLSNLLSSTNIATLFLDPGLRIKRFTSATTRLMNLIPGDVGRPVADIVRKYADDALEGDCRQVLDELRPVEREIVSEAGEWYLRRVQPYRTQDNRIDGTVVTFTDVTAIKRRDEEHAKLASIVDASEDAIIGMSLDGSITSWNPGAEATYGYSAREMLGRSLDPLFPDRDLGEAKHILEEIRAGRRMGPYETQGLHKDGSRIPLSVSVSPIRDGSGHVIAASTIARDITERRDAEAALRERLSLQDRLTRVAATVPGAICSYRQDADGNACMPYASPAIEDLCGVRPEDVAHDFGPIRTRVHADDLGHFDESIQASARSLAPWRDTWRYRHPSKGEIWIEGQAMPSLEPDGSILWHGYIQDVTERKRADTELLATQQRLRAVMDALPVGLAVARDTGCQSIDGNPALRALFGAGPGDDPCVSLTNTEAAGRRPRYYRAGRELHDFELPLQRAVTEKTTVPPTDLEVVLEDGRRWLAEISAAPILDQHGGVMGGVAVVSDVTERKRTQQALVEADRRKNEFLAMLAHELRNPLAPIRNAVEVLSRQDTLPEKVRWATELIGRQSEQLELLVSDLLDVSRITNDRIELRKQPLALQDALNDSLQGMAHQIEAARHTVEARLAEAPVIVIGDRMRLSQVFTNLLRNAVDYTPEGGHIWVTLTHEAGDAVVRIRDDGIGIRAEDLEGLFDIFYRGSRKDRDAQGPNGLGIGLNLARRLVRQHGGVLEARSDGAGQGSEFLVRLPVDDAAEPIASPAGAGARAQAPRQIRRLLVVDDNPDVVDSFKVLLETMGHQVKALNAGRGLVQAIWDFRPDLVFLARLRLFALEFRQFRAILAPTGMASD